MTDRDSDHQTSVAAWIQRCPRGAAPMVQAFEDTFAALWQRSHVTLGEVTLTAIVERVLFTAVDHHPFLGAIEITSNGLHCQGLRAHANLPRAQLVAALRFVLVEFLTVLGNLTAQILTPALHAELSKRPAKDIGNTQDEAS